jgi:hypothetical protein
MSILSEPVGAPHLVQWPTDKHSPDLVRKALVSFLTNLRGTMVVFKTTDGSLYEGLFSKFEFKEERINVFLKHAQLCLISSEGRNRNPVITELALDGDKIVSMKTVVLPSVAKGGGFQTDGEIAARVSNLEDRELVAWAPASEGSALGGLEDEGLGRGKIGDFDQFATHARMVKRTQKEFDLSDYSTEIDKSSAFYKQNERKAERLAREIMNSSSTNSVVLEERGQLRSNVSEEDRFSTVLKSSAGIGAKEGHYLPPHLRKAGATKGKLAPPSNPTSSITSTTAAASGLVSAGKADKEKAGLAANKPASKLSADAKEFTLNIKAKEFVPSFGVPKSKSAPALPTPIPPQHFQQQKQQQQQMHPQNMPMQPQFMYHQHMQPGIAPGMQGQVAFVQQQQQMMPGAMMPGAPLVVQGQGQQMAFVQPMVVQGQMGMGPGGPMHGQMGGQMQQRANARQRATFQNNVQGMPFQQQHPQGQFAKRN